MVTTDPYKLKLLALFLETHPDISNEESSHIGRVLLGFDEPLLNIDVYFSSSIRSFTFWDTVKCFYLSHVEKDNLKYNQKFHEAISKLVEQQS